MTELPVELLACPRCAASLRRESDEWVCSGCGTRFPSVGGIPWLLPDPAASLGEWRDRLHRLVLELQRQADGVRRELEAPELLTATRSRLKLLAQAYSDHARRLQSLLAPLALEHKQTSLETHLALRTRLPPGQDLASYYVNVHRDWVWGEEENRAALDLADAVMGAAPAGKVLVLGAGACRFAHDLHVARKPALTVATDINPLLLLLAARVLAGQKVALYEFPIAPRTIDDYAVLRELAAPAPAEANFHLAFADALHPPFAPGQFDTVVTPWFIDIVAADLAEVAPRINRLLAPGGRWVNFGSVAFSQREAARCYSLEETLQVIARCGFSTSMPREASLPYMRSPASRHARIESVVAFVAGKTQEVAVPPVHSILPAWIVHDDQPVPLLPDFQMNSMATRIHAFVMGMIDGRRSLKDMAEVLVAQKLMAPQDAAAAVRTFLIRMYEDSRGAGPR